MEKFDLVLEKLGAILLEVSFPISIIMFGVVFTGSAMLFFGSLSLLGICALTGIYLTHRSFIRELELRKRYRHLDGTWHYICPRPPLLSGGKTSPRKKEN